MFALVEASADLGASGVRTFFKIVLPSILPGVIAAALLAFTLSVDEFIIAYFTAGAGPSSTTLPMQIYAMIRFGALRQRRTSPGQQRPSYEEFPSQLANLCGSLRGAIPAGPLRSVDGSE